jgi:hypothetical protein
LDATTTKVGIFSIISCAKLGPERIPYFNLPSNNSSTASEINYSVSTIIPFEQETRGTLRSRN